MSTTTLVAVSDYLKSSYRPDCDYVDGKIEERNVGEHDHAALQAALILWFGQRQQEWNIEVLPEQRIKISATRFRVPDVCLVSLDQPVEQILTKPPLTCIEILSPEDTLRRMQERIGDYRQFGVANIWILDPATQRGYDCQSSGFLDATEFKIPGTPIHLVLPELFLRMRPRL
ncbi:MAG TPA: Uma2 family endonuclease [Candidatus Polarisedimenticolia bacterium]|nr:Uma2 family endonuclease [Candidatus Polarisedimenticolia bacterium]